jgi:hypothetical protein
MSVDNVEEVLEETVAEEPVVEETPPSDNGLPEEYNQALADYVDESEADKSTETLGDDESASEGSEENSAPEPRQPNEWDTLRTEAKALGINSKGMNKSDLGEEVTFQRDRRDALNEYAMDRHGLSLEEAGRYGTDELERALSFADRTLAQQHRRQPEQQAPEPAQQQQQQQPPPQQTEPVEGDIYAMLSENYDDDDPAVMALNQQHQQIQQLQQRYNQQAQAQQNEQLKAHYHAFYQCVDQLGMPELFGEGDATTPEQTQAMVGLFDTYGALYQGTGGQGDMQDLVDRALAADYPDAVFQKRQQGRETSARQQASTKMGSTAGVQRNSALPPTHEDDDEYGPNEYSELHNMYRGFESVNGSR